MLSMVSFFLLQWSRETFINRRAHRQRESMLQTEGVRWTWATWGVKTQLIFKISGKQTDIIMVVFFVCILFSWCLNRLLKLHLSKKKEAVLLLSAIGTLNIWFGFFRSSFKDCSAVSRSIHHFGPDWNVSTTAAKVCTLIIINKSVETSWQTLEGLPQIFVASWFPSEQGFFMI